MTTSMVSSNENIHATSMSISSIPALFNKSKRVLRRAQTKTKESRVNAAQHDTAPTPDELSVKGSGLILMMKSWYGNVECRRLEERSHTMQWNTREHASRDV